MPAGQGVLATSLLDVGELDRIGDRIEARERERSVHHAEQLCDVLALHRTLAVAGMELATAAQVALLMGCSEYRANAMLAEAKVLQRLGALEPMRQELMTVEQARVVADLLGPVADDGLAASLWERLQERLTTDQQEGNVRPPARLRELLRGWLIAADPQGAVERQRSDAEDTADVELWKRDNGLVDLVIRSLSPADAQACVDQIEQRAEPIGPEDERSTGMRRRDAARDLLLGRTALPFDPETAETSTDGVHGVCCPSGSAAPCGASVFVHVTLDSALQESSVPAELVGHGPIDPAALTDLLTAQPVLHRVWVDSNGVPVAVDDRTWQPGRDPDALRQMLHDMRDGPPPDRTHPRHSNDHPHPATAPPTTAPTPVPISGASRLVLRRPHLADPGPYRPSTRQQRLLRVRAPRCEWPGCGQRASRAVAAGCDLDHDLAWPFGPTCACNLGPLCRRHHRIKQLGWIKHRRPDGSIRWTNPAGRAWTSPNQHTGPATHRRPREHVAPGVWRLAA